MNSLVVDVTIETPMTIKSLTISKWNQEVINGVGVNCYVDILYVYIINY